MTEYIYPIVDRSSGGPPPQWTGFGTHFFASDDVSVTIVGFSLDRFDVMQVHARVKSTSENAPTVTRGLRFVIEQNNGITVDWKELEVICVYGVDKHGTYAECIAHHHLQS